MSARPRMDCAVWEKTAPQTAELADAELAAATSGGWTPVDALDRIVTASTGRHGVMDEPAVIRNADAWRSMFAAVTP